MPVAGPRTHLSQKAVGIVDSKTTALILERIKRHYSPDVLSDDGLWNTDLGCPQIPCSYMGAVSQRFYSFPEQRKSQMKAGLK